VANHLASESKRTGVTTKISAEDAINHGVPADAIFHNPKDRYPTVKANAAKVFASEKAPLNSRAKPSRVVSSDTLATASTRATMAPRPAMACRPTGWRPSTRAISSAAAWKATTAPAIRATELGEHKAWTERMDALSLRGQVRRRLDQADR
jgi:hypothetical protein